MNPVGLVKVINYYQLRLLLLSWAGGGGGRGGREEVTGETNCLT